MTFPVTVHGDPLATSIRTKAGEGEWAVPEEVPVAFVYNRRNFAMMMASPSDLTDFAVGFSLTEEVINSPDDIISLDIYLSDKGADLRFKISKDALDKLDITQRRRNVIGSASCGICGLENAETLFRVLPQVAENKVVLDDDAMRLALKDLSIHQPLNAETYSVHAAAWIKHDGSIELLREDVGRHNALDKLLGVMARRKVDASNGFVLMSSRCSYEIVEKAARRGVQAILSVSAPTAFALRKAKEANMAIYTRYDSGAVRLL